MKNIFRACFTLFLLSALLFYCVTAVAQSAGKVKHLKLLYDETVPVSPGAFLPIGVEVTFKNGKVKQTKGYAGGKYNWKRFKVLVQGGTFREGYVRLHNSPDRFTDHQLKVVVQLASAPTVSVTETLTLEYTGTSIASFSGANGSLVGQRGGRLMPLRIFGVGVSGKQGHNGNKGQDGDSIAVYVTTDKTGAFDDVMLKIEVRQLKGKRTERFIVNPNGGQFVVRADGGHGSPGGQGGPGVDGRDGADRGKDGTDGSDGGDGGNGGNGGNGGFVVFYVDPSAEAYAELLDYSNEAGQGGPAGLGGEGGYGGAGANGCSDGDQGGNGAPGVSGQPGRPGQPPTFKTMTVTLDW